MEGSKFGNVDISIGQATAEVYYPNVGIVFEMDNKKNIGFVAARADGNKTTDFLKVNKKYSETDDASNQKFNGCVITL